MSAEPTGNDVANRLRASFAALCDVLPEARIEAVPGGWSMFTGAPVPTFNGVWATGEAVDEAADADAIADALAAVTERDVPYCIQARPPRRDAAAQAAARLQMPLAIEVPLMTIVGPVSGPEPRELAIRRLEPTESRLHCALLSAGFDVPEEVFAALMTADALAVPAVRAYVGEVNAVPVCTAIGLALDDAVGIFNVATAPGHRGRGYGAAITARAIADGRAAGATWSWLQSTEEGYGVYQRLGFRTLEHWACWVAG